MTQTLAEWLKQEWEFYNDTWNSQDPRQLNPITGIEIYAKYYDVMPDLQQHPVLFLAKQAILAQSRSHMIVDQPHPFMDIIRGNWSNVFIEGSDPQRDLDIFDWLFSRAKMNTEWVRYYRYSDKSGFIGSDYWFKDAKLAILFKLTWG